jgi:hypothetical protein
VQQSLHVLDGGGEGQGPNAGRVAIEGHHVVTPRRAIPKDEDPRPSCAGSQLRSPATQETGEIEIARLKGSASQPQLFNLPFVDTQQSPQKVHDHCQKPLAELCAEARAFSRMRSVGETRNFFAKASRNGQAPDRLVSFHLTGVTWLRLNYERMVDGRGF